MEVGDTDDDDDDDVKGNGDNDDDDKVDSVSLEVWENIDDKDDVDIDVGRDVESDGTRGWRVVGENLETGKTNDEDTSFDNDTVVVFDCIVVGNNMEDDNADDGKWCSDDLSFDFCEIVDDDMEGDGKGSKDVNDGDKDDDIWRCGAVGDNMDDRDDRVCCVDIGCCREINSDDVNGEV